MAFPRFSRPSSPDVRRTAGTEQSPFRGSVGKTAECENELNEENYMSEEAPFSQSEPPQIVIPALAKIAAETADDIVRATWPIEVRARLWEVTFQSTLAAILDARREATLQSEQVKQLAHFLESQRAEVHQHLKSLEARVEQLANLNG